MHIRWRRKPDLVFLAVSALICAGFLFTRLGFTPVPWPDGSAFFLPGVDWFTSGHWRMHAQAAFVPSYERANFNTMPALPLIFGVCEKLGLARLFGAVEMTRLVSLIALVGATYALWNSRRSPWSLLVACAMGLDPVNRWGTLVVRTETWIGWIWVLLLLNWLPKKNPWLIAAGLAGMAYFHFEAAYLVPACAVAILADRQTGIRLAWASFWRTLLFLSPWIIYLLLNWKLFWLQMDIQFHRLDQANRLVDSGYALFHSLFISHGSPASWPKFFNVGKALFWILLAGVTGLTLKSREPLKWAGAVAFFSFFYLWLHKPEIWFTTLCHLAFWPWILTFQPRKGLVCLVIAYVALSAAAAVAQAFQIPQNYTWSVYKNWTDCIDRELRSNRAARVWQPHLPDALIELQERGGYDLTRTLDFDTEWDRATRFALGEDAVVLSTYFNSEAPDYIGPERTEDRTRMENGIAVPFGPQALARMSDRQYLKRICEIGPFWAEIAVKKNTLGLFQ